jgi:hypothetical protein
MQPDHYEVSTEGRRPLSGYIQKRGTKLGMPTWGGFLFGSPFVAAGIAILLVGAKVIPVNPASVHAPFWVVMVFGVSFALGGIVVWGMAWRQFTANRSRLEAARRYPGEPALADYAWHPDGFAVSEWTGAATMFAWAIGMTIFLSMFNWWAFGMNGPWLVKGVVGLFDLITLWTWVQAVIHLLRAFTFGHSRIDFTPFPYRLQRPVVIRWLPSRGVSRVNRGTFTLRCVEEWIERRGTGKNQSATLVHEEIWSAKWIIEQPCTIQSNDPMELRYDLPADALPTQLSADKPLFWELEVILGLPGVNFNETYLVPIYDPT